MTRLRASQLTLGYGDRTVSSGLDLAVPDGKFTAVIGANACGKSTLLRALVRLLPPRAGRIVFDGADLSTMRGRDVARRIGFLSQGLSAPEGIRVEQLVKRGRHAHRTLLGTWSDDDQRAVEEAMVAAGVTELADRLVEELSGGQAQRAWIAMVLAQETSYLLLDEPTTFLDMNHQYELLNLLCQLRDRGRTIVAVLHDVNQACRSADHVVAMKGGRIVAEGAPSDVVDAALVKEVFGLDSVVVPDPVTGTPMVVPLPPPALTSADGQSEQRQV